MTAQTTELAAAEGVPSTSDDGDVVLEVGDLRTEFGAAADPVRAVRGVGFALVRGQTLILLGESGSGKSVTARSILRLYGSNARISGRARLGDLDLLTASKRELQSVRGRRIGLVPQDPNGALDPLRTIGAQLGEVLRQHKMVTSRTDARNRSVELLRLVGIPDADRIARCYPHQLSGGMRQRAAIALAISCDPEVLIADEPTTALDVTVQAQILELFGELQRRLGIAILLVTHDVGVAAQLAHQVAVMYAGRIVETGPAVDVLERPSHPYTAALLASLPKPGIPRGELTPIKGRASLAHERTTGCPFAARCDRASAESRRAEPDLQQIAAGRFVACVNPLVGASR